MSGYTSARARGGVRRPTGRQQGPFLVIRPPGWRRSAPPGSPAAAARVRVASSPRRADADGWGAAWGPRGGPGGGGGDVHDGFGGPGGPAAAPERPAHGRPRPARRAAVGPRGRRAAPGVGADQRAAEGRRPPPRREL